MALTDAQLQILITAVDNASAGLASVRAAMASTEASAVSLGSRITSVGKSIQSFGSSMQSAGTAMTMGFTVPLALVGGASIKMASDFGASMELIHTQAGASQSEVDNMSKSVLALAQTVPVGPEALATGLYHVESLGLRGAQAMDVLKYAAEGAALSGSDMEATASALGAVIQSGIGGVNGYADAMGQLNGIVGAGNMRMQDLVDSMSSGILGVAREFGVSLRDIGASMDVMADSGVPAINTATRLRMTLPALAGATTAAAKGMKELGLGQTQIANDMRSPGGLMQALQDLKAHLDAYTTDPSLQADMLSKMFGGGRSSSVILGLINQLPLLQQKLDMVSQQGKTFGEDFATYLGLPQAKWKQFVADVQVDAIKLGNVLLPLAVSLLEHLQPFIDGIGTLIQKFQSLPPTVQTSVLIFVALLAAMGPVLFVAGAITSSFGALVLVAGALVTAGGALVSALGVVSASWIGVQTSAFLAYAAEQLAMLGPAALVVGAIAAIVLIATHWDSVRSAAETAMNGVANAAQTVFPYVALLWTDMISNMLPPVPSWAGYVEVVIQTMGQYAVSVWGAMESAWVAMWNRLPNYVQGPLAAIKDELSSWLSDVGGMFSSMWSGIEGMFGGGGGPSGVPKGMSEEMIDGKIHYFNSRGMEIANPFASPGTPPGGTYNPYVGPLGDSGGIAGPPTMPPLPPLPPIDFPGLGGGGGAGGTAGKGSVLSQAQLDLMALAQAFDAFHQQTQGTIFDFQVLLKIGSDQADLDKRAEAAGLALAAANMEAVNSGFQLKKGLVEIAEYMVKTGETLTEVFRDIAQKAEDSLNSAFNALFNRPTREGAALQLQIDILQQQEDQLKASGATQDAIDAVQKQIDQLNQQATLRADAIKIMKDQNTLADATLLTDQQQQFAATLYTIAIGTQSQALKSLSDQATLEALARFNLINAMNEHADALRAGLTSGASGGSVGPAAAPASSVASSAPVSGAVTSAVTHNYIHTVEIHGDPQAGLAALGASV